MTVTNHPRANMSLDRARIPGIVHSAATCIQLLVERYGDDAPLDITVREIRSSSEPADVVRIGFSPGDWIPPIREIRGVAVGLGIMEPLLAMARILGVDEEEPILHAVFTPQIAQLIAGAISAGATTVIDGPL